MHRHHTATAALTAALVLALGGLLAGCGGSTPDPPPDPTPTPSASPSRTPPALPDAATRHTKAGALAFAKHYIELLNYAQATGDTQALRSAEGPKCKSCISVERHLHTMYSNGGYLVGGELQVTGTNVLPNPETHGYNVDVALKAAPEVVHRTNGETEGVKGGRNILTLFLAHRADGWKVLQWSRAK